MNTIRGKSLAQLQNEQVEIGIRIQELNIWLSNYQMGLLRGNPRVLDKKARSCVSEIRRLQNKAQQISMAISKITMRSGVY